MQFIVPAVVKYWNIHMLWIYKLVHCRHMNAD